MNDNLRDLNTQKQEALDGSPAIVNDEAGYIHIKFQRTKARIQQGVEGTNQAHKEEE